jgi:hypothetical protein
MNYKRFQYYIVVDGENRPMSFYNDQFCYNDTECTSRPFALSYYTLKEARKLIKKTIEFRNSNNFSIDEYFLMPILVINPL